MKIALLVPTLVIGGVERVFVHLANGFFQCGVDVDLVVGLAGGDLTRTVNPGIRIIDLKSQRMLKSISALAKYMNQNRPDALIAGMTHSTAAAVMARSIARVPLKIVATEHSTMTQVIRHARGLKYRLMPMWSRWALSSSDAIVAVSQGVAEDLAARTGIARDTVQVIYNPSIPRSMQQMAAQPVDHPWFQPGQPPVVLGVGRLDQQKDFSTLMRAFKQVRENRTARLVILGEGPDRSYIEQTVHDLGLEQDVALPGFDSNPYRYMKRAAVFALSSRYEGFGVVLAEALACGVPVVSTDCTYGPSEILCDGKFGALVPVGNAEKMAEAILGALDQPVKVDCAEHLQQFTVEHVAASYISLVNSL